MGVCLIHGLNFKHLVKVVINEPVIILIYLVAVNRMTFCLNLVLTDLEATRININESGIS